MKRVYSIAVSLIVVILLSSGGLLVTHAVTPYTSGGQHSSSQGLNQPNLSLQVEEGGIVSAGSQVWTMSGGNLAGAQLGSAMVAPGAGHLDYSMNANVNGLSASGTFHLGLRGVTTDGNSINLIANGVIMGYVPSICFPNYDTPDASGNCPNGDTSGIPAFFEAGVVLTETLNSVSTTIQTMLMIEAPILNPFGAPIVISTPDNSIAIVATYSHGVAIWNGVQLGGVVSGTYNGQSAAGSFTQTTHAVEQFVSGTEHETGSISLSVSTLTSSLNAQGGFIGTSKVPMPNSTNSFDCSALVGLPTGTCLETSLVSTGVYQMSSGDSHGTVVLGNYDINWPAPSINFVGTLNANVLQHGN